MSDRRCRLRSSPARTSSPTRTCAGARAAATTPSSRRCRRCCPSSASPRENFVFISGIGCSSRFPYYMNTYGFHSHPRPRAGDRHRPQGRRGPELSVWVVTGDGDGSRSAATTCIHVLRRNVDVNILLFNNRIYGLTKGQYSPTSELGKVTKSTPLGSVDHPFNPIVARARRRGDASSRAPSTSRPSTCRRSSGAPHEHRGASFVEILQNCNIFNDGAFDALTEKDTQGRHAARARARQAARLRQEPRQGHPPARPPARGRARSATASARRDLLVHDERDDGPRLPARRMQPPDFPTPIGVFRAVERPTYDEAINAQIAQAKGQQGVGDLDELFGRGDTWDVPA